MEVGSAGALRPGDPERLGGYAISGRLGEGGQGTVYVGRGDDGEPVAIKLLHQDLTGNERARSRFLREVEVAKQVSSFCTARIVDVAVEGERPYIVSEYVNGPSLRAQVEDEGPLSGGTLDRLAIGTATALVVIHRAGVVHRDLKPANVLLGPDGPRVIDFGIAKPLDSAATVSSRVLGTPAFMAPEQLRGAGVSKAADVFAWASTIVYAAKGAPPYGQDTIPAVVNRILHEEPDLEGLQEPLRSLLARCLDKDPERRPDAQRALMSLLGQDDPAVAAPLTVADVPDGATEEIATALLQGRANDTLPTEPRTPLKERLRRLSRRQWALGGGVAAALVAVAIALGVMVMFRSGDATQAGNRNPPKPPASSTSSTPTTEPVAPPPSSEPTEEPSDTESPTDESSPTEADSDTPYDPEPTHTRSTAPSKKPSEKPTDKPTSGPSGDTDNSSG